VIVIVAWTSIATVNGLTTLVSPHPQINGDFGSSVAVGDRVVVVGAPSETVSGKNYAGRAYVFALTGALIITLVSPHSQYNGNFGVSVAVGDRVVVVGARGETVGGKIGAGRAYVFSLTGDLTHTLVSPNSQNDGNFGSSVAVGDSVVVVGAPGETVSGNIGAGRAYVFALTGALTRTLVTPSPQTYGEFGWSVAVGDGAVAVGAYGEAVYETGGRSCLCLLPDWTPHHNAGQPQLPTRWAFWLVGGCGRWRRGGWSLR